MAMALIIKLTLELLDLCRENGIHIVLHPPHTSHISQVEDIANFWDFKWSLCITNAEVLSEKQLEAMADPNMLPYAKLTNADLLQCCQKGWMAAFDETNCLLGWQKVRLRPFTRSVFWELKRSQVKAVDVRQHATLQTGLNFDFLQMKAI